MARWTRLVGGMLAMLAALGTVGLAADRIFTNPKVEPHLRALFPKAAAFSPLEGTPLHFKAYAADPKTTPNPPLLGYAFWTTDLVPNEYGYHGPIHILVGMDLTGILSGAIVDYDSEPYGYFSVQPPEFAAQFVRKSVRAPFRVGGDVAAVSRATITISSAARAIRDSSRAMAKAFLNPADVKPVIQPADPWGFEEEPVETWTDLLNAQAGDLVPLAAFLLLAYVSFHRKSVRLKYLTLAVSVAYMGFYKSNLLSITDVFRVVDWSFPPLAHNLAWYLFAGFTLASTVLWGRFYCGRVCAYGAFTQLMDAALPKGWRVDVPPALEARAGWIKFGILASVLTYYAVTHNTMVYRYVEPFWMFGRSETSPVLWAGLGGLIVATVFVRNLYCRFLCPLGAAIGLVSFATVFRIKRWSECSTCRICEKACEWGAIQGPKILVTECVRCDDCERLYADTAKCPHWRILDYRSRKGGTIPLTPVRG